MNKLHLWNMESFQGKCFNKYPLSILSTRKCRNCFLFGMKFFLYSGVHGRMGGNPNYCEIFTVINSVTTTLLNQRYKFRTIKYWFYPIPTHIYVLGSYEFQCFVYPTSLSCASHFIYICTIAMENIRNIPAISTSQFADVLLFYDNQH